MTERMTNRDGYPFLFLLISKTVAVPVDSGSVPMFFLVMPSAGRYVVEDTV